MAHAVRPAVPAPKPTAPEDGAAKDLVEKTEPARQPTPVVPEKAVEGARSNVANRDVQPKRQDTNSTPPQTQPETNVSQMPSRPGGGGIGPGGGLSAAAPQPPAPVSPATAPTVQAPANTAVVMATRDGNVQALTPEGKTLTLADNQAVPLGFPDHHGPRPRGAAAA